LRFAPAPTRALALAFVDAVILQAALPPLASQSAPPAQTA